MDYSVWETNYGELIHIKDMTTKHIQSCIKMIKRSKWLDVMEHYDTVPNPPPRYVDYKQYQPYLKMFEDELKGRE